MRERDVRKMLRQDVRGRYVMRPLHEFVVTRTTKQKPPDDDAVWSFSWDGATLHYAEPDRLPASAPAQKDKPTKR